MPKKQSRVIEPNKSPNLAYPDNELIDDMVHSDEISPKDIALAAGYDKNHFNGNVAFCGQDISQSVITISQSAFWGILRELGMYVEVG